MKFINFIKNINFYDWIKISLFPVISTIVMFFIYRFNFAKTGIYFICTLIGCIIGMYIAYRKVG